MTLRDLLLAEGAALAPDGIPLHFGDVARDYRAALDGAALFVRSHEGRLRLTGRDRLAVVHRISTNDVEHLPAGEGRPTVFTNANARILERATVFHRADDALLLTEPGRGPSLAAYLRRNIFFGDELRVDDVTTTTAQLDLHGPTAGRVIDALAPGASALPEFGAREAAIGAPVWLARVRPLAGSHWTIVCAAQDAPAVWRAAREAGAMAAGSLAYNALRIRAGRPAAGRELTTDYLPLEVGLWDEVSFQKGCYTGQEIIARMESRHKLAKVMVRVRLSAPLDAPAELAHEGRSVGTLTSSVTAPDGDYLGLAVVRLAAAGDGERLRAGDVEAVVLGFAGAAPPMASG